MVVRQQVKTKRSADLISYGLEQSMESVPVSGHSQTFESMVVVSSGRIVCRDNIIASSFHSMEGGRVYREGFGSGSHRNDCIIGPDSSNHDASSTESIKKWTSNTASFKFVELNS
jgi:hypothetical protein